MNLPKKQSHGYCLCFNDRNMMKNVLVMIKGLLQALLLLS